MRSQSGYREAIDASDGRVAEWFKAPVLKTGRGFTLPRGFESHPFRQPRRIGEAGPLAAGTAPQDGADRHRAVALTSPQRLEFCVGDGDAAPHSARADTDGAAHPG